MVSLIYKIAEENIPLEILDLTNIKFIGDRSSGSQLVEVVSKLKNLHTLKLKHLVGLPNSHYYLTCKNLPQLRRISLMPRYALNPALISDIIRNADQLEWIHLTSMQRSCEKPLTIDSGNFREWVKFFTERCNNTPLEMWLCADSYASKHTIPVKASGGPFTLLICDGLQRHGTIDYEECERNLHSTCRFVTNF